MSLTKEQIKSAAMQLDPADREALAEELLYSVTDAERDEIERALLEEVHRRAAQFERGEVQAISLDEALANIQSKARKR